jgi:methylmalonyl-CoA mutase C-terminal domain/subunit
MTTATVGPPIRAVLAKSGLDGHDRGAKVVAMGLRDAGMEVIYTGLRVTPEAIARIAEVEDVDVVLLSILSGAHLAICGRVCRLLRPSSDDNSSATTVPVIVGGIIPDEDIERLKEIGVVAVFQPGSAMKDIVAEVRRCAAEMRANR